MPIFHSSFESEDEVLTWTENLIRKRNALLKEVDAAMQPLCSKDGFRTAEALLIKHRHEWQGRGKTIARLSRVAEEASAAK